MPPDPPSSHAYAHYYHPATILFPPAPNSKPCMKPCSVFLVGKSFYQKITIMCMGMSTGAWEWPGNGSIVVFLLKSFLILYDIPSQLQYSEI